MAVFFDNFEEIKDYVASAYINMEFESIAGFTNIAGESFLVPILGLDEYNDLVEKWQAGNTSASFLAALNVVRPAVAYFSMYLLAEEGGVIMTDDGLQRKEDDSNKSAWQWQSVKYRRAQLSKGWTALYSMLDFYKKNVVDYPIWEASEERENVCKVMVPTLLLMKKYASIEDFATWWAVLPLQDECQRLFLDKILGEDFTEELLDAIYNDDADADEEKVIPMVQEITAKYALFNGLDELPFRVTSTGVYVDTLEDGTRNIERESQDLDNTSKYSQKVHSKMDKVVCKLTKFLNENASETKYVSYYNEFIKNKPDAPTMNEGGTFFM